MAVLLPQNRTRIDSFRVPHSISSDLPSDKAYNKGHDFQHTKKLDMEKVPSRDLQVWIPVHL